MSAIDQYYFKCLGYIECLSEYSRYDIIAIYRLDQDIPEYEDDFQGKKGDILVGGGGGEVRSMRIAIPEAFRFWTHEEIDDDDDPNTIMKTYWDATEAYILGDGFVKLGWQPKVQDVEFWLTQHVLSFLVREHPEDYLPLVGTEPLELDGSICHRLTH
jgi:hypothetical protein